MKTNEKERAPGADGAAVWRIGRRRAACATCARSHEEGSRVYSVLRIDEAAAAALVRLDYCGGCNRAREKSPAEILWRSEFHAEPKKAKLDLAALSEVFRQLAESADPRVRDLRYLVTLLLLRHRKLRVASTRTGETQDFLVVSFGRAKQTFDVEVSDLPAERLEALRAQLLAVFQGGDALAAPEAAAPPDTPPEASPPAVAPPESLPRNE
jgi:hypothetical protein